MTPTVVPINLGCCPEVLDDRCALCTGLNEVSAEIVEALVDEYADGADSPLQVSFFGGPPPSETLVAAARGLPLHVRVRPDLLSRDEARRLLDAGLVSVELDALTLSAHALRRTERRGYKGPTLRAMAEGLKEMGLRVGVVLAPGLPGSDLGSALADAREVAEWADFARLHPVLVFAGSELATRWKAERYEPMTVEDAVEVCRQMVDILEAGGVEVIRVGQQPRPDGLGRALAGPLHPSLRQVVESRRTLDRIRGLLDDRSPRERVVIRCAPADETRTRGPSNEHLRILRKEYDLQTVEVQVDPELPRGRVHIATDKEIA